MLIRSKNKMGIYEATNIIVNDNNEVVKIFSDDVYFLLGKYDSDRQCKDVLQYIYNCISSGHTIIDMPDDDFEIKSKPKTDQTMENMLPQSVINKLNAYRIYTMEDVIKNQKYIFSLKGIGPATARTIREAIKVYEKS